MRWLLITALLAGCYTDEYGFSGTRWMLKQMAKQRKDGSMACYYVFTRSVRFNTFSWGCTYEPEEQVCSCRDHRIRSFDDSAFLLSTKQSDEIQFRVHPCFEELPEELDFPLRPSFVKMLRELRELAKQIGKELPPELDEKNLNTVPEEWWKR